MASRAISRKSSCRSLSSVKRLNSVPNLRLLCNRPCKNSFQPAAGLYRSSKPDRITKEDLEEFREFGIRCIIDFRSSDEYFNHSCDRLLDNEYILQKVILPKTHGGSPTFKQLNSTEQREGLIANEDGGQDAELQTSQKNHFLINFFTGKYILKTFSRLPCYFYCVGIFHLICDLLTGDKSFSRFSTFFTSTVVRRRGISGQYKDIVEFCQPSICAALKIIAEPANHPALLNCAHGKDRTGIVSALVLTCLGLPKEYICEEYALSEEGLEPIVHLIRQDLIDKYKMSEEFLRADANTMMNLLFYLEDKYGSVENYMDTIGFSHAEQMALRVSLIALEDPPEDD